MNKRPTIPKSDRKRLKSILPAIIAYAETELPTYVEQSLEEWFTAVQDASLYAAGMTQSAIGRTHSPPVPRQTIEQRIKSVVRQVRLKHPELPLGNSGPSLSPLA